MNFKYYGKSCKCDKQYIVKYYNDPLWIFSTKNSAFRFINALKESNPLKYGEKFKGSTCLSVQIKVI